MKGGKEMRIKTKYFGIGALLVGVVLTGYLAHDLKTNPRWAGDNGPGVGKLPKQIVAGYLDAAYKDGGAGEAAKLYFSPKTKDLSPESVDRKDGPAVTHHVRKVLGEGMVVMVYHCVGGERTGQALEVVDIFRTWNGRLAERVQAAAQPVERCEPTPPRKNPLEASVM